MTVISTIISRYCTAHATDSLVTQKQGNGAFKILEDEKTKIVCVQKWAGIISYWGLAQSADFQWSTLDWLKNQLKETGKFPAPEDFATHLGETLNQELSKMQFRDPIDKGIGMHFTVYERIDDFMIPELFAITNFENTTYQRLHRDGVHVTRETYGASFGVGYRGPEHGHKEYRHEVRKFLEDGNLLQYNNGDPLMFNSVSGAIWNLIRVAEQRSIAHVPENTMEHRQLASWPIKLVSDVQRNFVMAGYQRVGGKLHTLSVTSNSKYESDTGDLC